MKVDKGRGLSLFYRLLIVSLGVVIFISGALTVVFYNFSKGSFEKHAQEDILRQFGVVDYHFRYEFRDDLTRNLSILASNPTLDEFLMSSEIDKEITGRAVERLFLQSIHYVDSYQGISFVDHLGKERVKVDRKGRIREYKNLRESKLFKQLESDSPDSISIEGPLEDKNGKYFLSIGIHKRDADIGKFGGAVIIDYGLDDFFGYLDKITIFGENTIWVLTPDGQVLKKPQSEKAILDPHKYLSKEFQETPKLSVFAEGIVVYQDMAVIPGKPLLRLAISVPSSLLLKDIKSTFKFLSIVFIISIAIISLVIYVMSHYLSKPIIELAHAATKLAKGDLSTQVKLKTSGEVQMLVDSFNQMAEDLEKTTVSKDYVDNIIKSMIDTLIVVSPEGKIIRANASACKILGYEEKELIGSHIEIIFAHGLQEAGPVLHGLSTNGFVSNIEKVYIAKDGREIPVFSSASVIRDSNNVIQGMVFLAQDITERKKAEAALRESEERYRSFLQNFHGIAFRTTIDFNPIFFHGDVEEITGCTADEFLAGRPKWERIVYHDDLPKIYESRVKIQSVPDYSTEQEYRIIRKDGQIRWVQELIRNICDSSGKPIMVQGAIYDINERKMLEEQLIHAQKMEAIGQLAGGVAHDFNNILTAIIGYASLLEMKMIGDDPLRHNVSQILASSQKAAHLTQSLLAFSRKQIINLKAERLNDIVRGIEKILLRVISEDIELKTVLADEDLTVMADSGQIEQVLMNLATNARDAMPAGGLLSIETGSIELDDEYLKIHGYGKPGIYALITVSDTGVGVEQRLRKKIFEPFFTTKEIGKGTGLGLAIVYGIIKQHNGYINMYSELGKGTTFKIYLPLTESKVEEIKSVEDLAPKGGTETLMLGEDEEEVRKLTKTILEEFGYSVIEAVDGEDAINKFIENKDKIELIILDVIMPKKNGKDAYEEIKKIKPDVKALFMSGYTADVVHQKVVLDERLQFILKPVSPTVLLNKLREMLDN